jgi:3-hydroxyisobutyrate dehydrogenase
MSKLAFIGAGMIASGMIEAACKRGHQVSVYNRTHSKAEALTAFGAKAFQTPAEAVLGADFVHIVLSDDEAVDGAIASCHAGFGGALVLDHSTVLPQKTRERAERLKSQGVSFLHAPVFMSPQSCRDATGMMLVAGDKEVYERVAEHLSKMTGSVKYLGDRSHIAAAYKLFGNAMLITIVAGLADVFAMTSSLGLAPQEALSLYEMFNPAVVLTTRGKKMAQGDYAAAFEMTMARKDIRLMIETAQDKALAVFPGIAARMDELIAKGFGSLDMGALAIGTVKDGGRG